MLKSIRCFVVTIALFGGFWAFSAPVTPFSEWFADAVAAYVGGESAGWSGETMSVTNTSHIAIDAPTGVSYAIPVQATDSYVSETIQIIADPQEWEDLLSPSSDELEGAKFAVCVASKDDTLVYAALVKSAPSEPATWVTLTGTPNSGMNTVTVQYNRNSNTVRFPDLDDRLFYALPASGSALTGTTFLGVGEICALSGQQTTADNAPVERPAVAANGEATTLSFDNTAPIFRGTDGNWASTANWFTGNEEDGWTVLGTNYPQKQGAGPYTPFLFDGDIMMRAGATKDAATGYYEVTCEELMEGWETRIAVYGGVHVSSTQGFTKLQGGVGNKWFFVDKDSKLTINHTRAGQTNNDLELHTAAPDGIEWTGNWSASPTVKYFFEGEGSVAYKAGLTVGTHQIHKFDLKLNEPSEVKYVAKKYLVNFGSEGSYTSTFALIDTPAVTLYEADGSVSETAVVKAGTVTETDDLGTYAIGQDAKGVYISFVNYAAPLPTEAFKFVGNSDTGTVSGWFNSWDGEGFGVARKAIGPGDYGLVPVADHVTNDTGNKWHPYKSFQLPETFTLSIYTDLSLVTNATKKAAIWAAGPWSGARVILSKLNDTVVVDTGSKSVSAALPETKGYHLYTVMFSTTEGVKIAIDGKVCASDATPANRPANGFQVGGVFQGVQTGYVTPQVLPVAAMVGYDELISESQLAQLAHDYPATTEAAGNDVTYATQGGAVFAGTMTCAKRVDMDRGTLYVPAGQTYSAPSLRFGNSQGNGENGTFGLELDGTLVIHGVSSKDAADYSGSSIREAVTTDEGGFLGGEWEGVGTYNIRGTLEVLGSYVQLCHDAHAQTYNIEEGGVMKVKGFQALTYGSKARSSHVLNIRNGGRVVSTEGFTRGALTAVVEAGGVLEIANTANVDMTGSNLSQITGAGQLKLGGTGYVLLPTAPAKYFADTLEVVNELSAGLYVTAADDFTIGSLSGAGKLCSEYNTGARTLTIRQSKDTTWSGALSADGQARLTKVAVVSENGSALTITGSIGQNPVLEVLAGGIVNLQTKWPTAGFIVDGTLNINYSQWVPVYLVKGAGTINWAGTNTFSVNAADGDDALIVEGTTINQTAGTLSLRAPGNRTADAAPDAIGYLKDATIISSSTLACSGKVGVKGACSITKTAGTCSISTIELSETEAVLTLTGVEMTVTSGVAGYRVQETDGAEGAKVYTLVPDRIVIAPGASADIVAASAEAAIAQATIDAPEALKPALQLIATEGAEDGHWTVTVDLNPEAVVEGVPVVPELAQVTVAEESVEPMALVDPDAVFGVKTIAGLWYAVEASATSDFASVTRTTPVQAIGSATKLTADLGTETVRYYRIVVSATETMK